MATHSSILAWEIPWTGGPGGPWCCKESGMTQRLNKKTQPNNLLLYLDDTKLSSTTISTVGGDQAQFSTPEAGPLVL